MTLMYGWGGEHSFTSASYVNNRNQAFSYDAAGNELSDGGQSYTYDAAGRQVTSSFGLTSRIQDLETWWRREISLRIRSAYMKAMILLCLVVAAPIAIHARAYKHKSEVEIAEMTPAQRVEEYAEEQAHHKYDVLDSHGHLIEKYIWRDGLKALPRVIEIMDAYDPMHASGKRGNKGERFDAMWMMLGGLDGHVVRLRGSEEGLRALDALEHAIQRMRAAGSGQKDQHEWAEHGRFDLAATTLEEAKGINSTDRDLRDTFRLEYKILLSKEELLEFSNFLVAHYPGYPSWSERARFRDYTQLNEAGLPLQVFIMKQPERFHEAYLEFKKMKG